MKAVAVRDEGHRRHRRGDRQAPGLAGSSTANCSAGGSTRAAAEIEAIALGVLRARIGSLRRDAALPTLAVEVAAGRLDPYAAADRLLAELG